MQPNNKIPKRRSSCTLKKEIIVGVVGGRKLSKKNEIFNFRHKFTASRTGHIHPYANVTYEYMHV